MCVCVMSLRSEKGNAILNKRRDERIVCPSYSSRGSPSKKAKCEAKLESIFAICKRTETSDTTWSILPEKVDIFID